MNTETKVCCDCKIEKPVSEFYKSNKRWYQRECKDCCRKRKYKWHQTDAGKLSSANTKLKRRFGIDINKYNEMLKNQDGKCLICGATESIFGHKLAVDHCHETNKIRGLLCKSCNVGLGHFRDNIENLQKAAEYLKNHEIK